jgi:hypothetical protein
MTCEGVPSVLELGSKRGEEGVSHGRQVGERQGTRIRAIGVKVTVQ